MLLADPDATPFDLRFRLFGVAVRVHPLFWLGAVFLGFNLTRNPVLSDNGMLDLAVWVLAVFLSILLHEFGHIWMGQVFGSFGHIVLHSMGGLAIGAANVPRSWQRILVCFAGPAIQLLLWAALIGLLYVGYRPEPRTPLSFLIGLLLRINLVWPLLNLLPIYPLDGGQITREVCVNVSPQNGVLTSLWISFVLTASLAAVSLLLTWESGPLYPTLIQIAPLRWLADRFDTLFLGIFMALFAVTSWQLLQAEKMSQRRSSYSDDVLPWER